jgi:GNAT superfamily N-acetyltransferase
MIAIEIVEADLSRPEHQQAVVDLTDGYAADAMGNGRPLPEDVRAALIPGFRAQPTLVIFLAYVGADPVGIATCFRGFSTFAARPLINIHDLAVLPSRRGQGIGRRLLEAVEQKARATGCCKVTLEVQEDNRRARRVYEAAGFAQTVYAEGAGGALFFSKRL